MTNLNLIFFFKILDDDQQSKQFNPKDASMKAVLSSLTFFIMNVLLPYSSWAEESGKFSVGLAYINGSSIYSN
ncbi:MAG: hypothetical protein CMK01_05040, partial [Planktomarina sp.]|nr:hypothetical protein [Planktomarina sp.]